jgi:hypothetical protein
MSSNHPIKTDQREKTKRDTDELFKTNIDEKCMRQCTLCMGIIVNPASPGAYKQSIVILNKV